MVVVAAAAVGVTDDDRAPGAAVDVRGTSSSCSRPPPRQPATAPDDRPAERLTKSKAARPQAPRGSKILTLEYAGLRLLLFSKAWPSEPPPLLLPPLPLSGQGRARAPAASWSSTPTRRRGVAMVEPAEALGWLTRLPWGPHAQLRRCLSAATEAWSLSRRQGATSVAGRCRSGRGRCLGAMHNPPSQHDFRSCCCSSSSSNTKREVQGSGGHPDGYPVRSEAIRFGLGRQR
mmetsp:Transcript_71822/g.181520  ORF Transcript_71822/g.181520 Transcript_71822/m.181520 type:complete len:232 (+) Transcript_71822:1195-1890(+)